VSIDNPEINVEDVIAMARLTTVATIMRDLEKLGHPIVAQFIANIYHKHYGAGMEMIEKKFLTESGEKK
jgi:hypothetical protein